MAKESTAVNALIGSVQSNNRLRISDPSDDLFASPKGAPTTTVNPPRMTATVPPMRGAGEVAPLPRRRSAGGTSQHKLPNPPLPVRSMTAPPMRGGTIPPLPQVTMRASAPAVPAKASAPSLPPPVRESSLPAPLRNTGALPVITRPSSKPTLPMPRGTRPPAGAPVAAPFEAKQTGSNPFVAQPLAFPIVQRQQTIDMTGDAVSAENWFEQSRAVEKFEEETYVGTAPVFRTRPPEGTSLVKKLIMPTMGLVIVGILVGGFVAFSGKKTHAAAPAKVAVVQAPVAKPVSVNRAPRPSTESINAATATAGAEQPEPPAPAAAVEPAPAPVAEPVAVAAALAPVAVPTPAPAVVAAAVPAPVREVQTTRGVVKLVDVRIDSRPAGATVMLVDNGKTSFLGTTPIATSLDPSRPYDVVFTLEGRPTQMAHLDPAKSSKLDVVLGKTATAVKVAATPAPAAREIAAPAPARAPAPRHHQVARSAPPSTELAEPSFDAPAPTKVTTKAEPASETHADRPAVSNGIGTLMVSSKPPCEILIDGKSTGMTTPQRAIQLPPGAHKITFVNTTQNINKTVAVSITADQTTKLIKDLLGS